MADKNSLDVGEVVLDSDAVRLLSEIALMSYGLMRVDLGYQMSLRMRRLCPESPFVRLLESLMLLSLGHGAGALETLRACVSDFPDFGLGRATLGAVMKLEKVDGWQGILEEVAEDEVDEAARSLAIKILGRPGAEEKPQEEPFADFDPPTRSGMVWA